MSNLRIWILVIAFGGIAGTVAWAMAQQPLTIAPQVSQETLKALEARGAYECSIELVDNNSTRLARNGGIRTREMMSFSSTISEQPNAFEISTELVNSDNSKLVFLIDVAHRTQIESSLKLSPTLSGSETSQSSNVRLVESVNVGEPKTVEIEGLRDSNGKPLKLNIDVRHFRAAKWAK